MSYNPGTGIYTLPAIYLAVPGTTIIAAQHNTPLEDLEVANNYARPIVAGGTGQNSAVLARGSTGLATEGNIGSKGTNIASAAALPLVADFNYFHVTGTVTVTSISTRTAGQRIVLEFEGVLILTHNATSLILPGGVNRTTAPGDIVEFVSEGAGNWRMSDNSPVACMITSAALSGATFPITIPTGAKRIVIALEDVQFNAGSTFGLKLGDSGGIESTFYFGSMSTLIATTSTALFSTQFNISPAAAPGFLVAGIIDLALAHINVAAPTWSYKSGIARTDVASTYFGAGQKTLTTELTSLELNCGATIFAGGRATVHVYF